MSIVDKLHSFKGVKTYLAKQEIVFKKDRELDKFFYLFFKDMGWKKHFSRNSPNYKGRNECVIDNAHTISGNFEEFKTWLKKYKDNE